jgi:putative heme-binding domain-containing protein
MRCLCVLVATLALVSCWPPDGGRLAAQGQPEGSGSGVEWIWANPSDQIVYFRKTFEIPRPMARPTDEAVLHVTADRSFIVWLNGTKVGTGSDVGKVHRFDVNSLTVPGKNVLAVQATGGDGPRGLLARLAFIPNGMSKLAVVSDGDWKVSPARADRARADGWEKRDFDDRHWDRARVIGPYGQTEPWKTLVWEGGGDDRFTVPPGFHVETVVPPKPNSPRLDPQLPFSLINLCFDARGRLLVAQERGPILLCTRPDKDGQLQDLRPYCTQVRGCQGMCWVDDALLLMGDGPRGTGLYRCRDTTKGDRIDQVELLLAVKGGMGEHGPHAIIHGPDDLIYVCMGNHAWARIDQLAANSPLTRWPRGQMGPDQGQPNTTEDVLLPRLNDARGHAANILAPGGTIWRLDKDGKNPALIAAGFRNHYDFAFNIVGELLTWDSDMEWDEKLPWYRPPRVCWVFPGADFLWRTGAANTPEYYLDSLPAFIDAGRGSPVGVETYDHVLFPDKYRGATFFADWSAGKILVNRPLRGNFMGGSLEEFCAGAPMNVTDLAVGPDGALYFCLGGRGTEGGVYRITTRGPTLSMRSMMDYMTGGAGKVDQAVAVAQPWSAYGRAKVRELKAAAGAEWDQRLPAIALDKGQMYWTRLRALDFMQTYGPRPSAALLAGLLFNQSEDENPVICAKATQLLGLCAAPEARKPLVEALTDGMPLVRRRACEALLRGGHEAPISELWLLLADQNKQVRTAARLLLQRADPATWIDKFAAERADYIAMEAIVALCKTNQAAKYSQPIAERLARVTPTEDAEFQLDYLRTWQLALIHCETAALTPAARQMLARLTYQFPSTDQRIAREAAILLTHGRRAGLFREPVHAKLLDALLREKDQAQQIHYFYCLRLLHEGWTPPQKQAVLHWYEGTRSWGGGMSFAPFLEHIFRDLAVIFTRADLAAALAEAAARPHAAATLLRHAPPRTALPPAALADAYQQALVSPRPLADLREALVLAAAKQLPSPAAQAALRRIGDLDPAQAEAVARALADAPSPESEAYYLRGLESRSPVVCLACIRALRQLPTRPKPDDPRPFRAVLTATARLNLPDRKDSVELLRQWTGKRFTQADGDWKDELESWGKWFAQNFPDEPPLPGARALTAASKWKYEELLAFLEKDPRARQGDPQRGRALMTKANCLKCHKFGSEGEGIGPDLTQMKSKFKRDYILEAILLPSKVVSDQYRGSVIQTKAGKLITGLAAPQGDVLVVVLEDGTKVTLQAGEIESIVASTVSPMPERALDEFTLEEIADLFAYLESMPK